MKIALACVCLGRVNRGFESFTESLFRGLRRQAPHLDVTLFQGGGKSGEHRVVIPHLPCWELLVGWLGPRKASLLEQRLFALNLYPLLRTGGYDVVHYNDLVMGSALFHLRRHFGGKFKLLYCNGAPSPPVHYHHRCDFAQMLTGPMHEEALSFGLSGNRLFFVPYGVDAQQFSPKAKEVCYETRKKLGIPEKAKVVLTVAALKKEHKRVDYLIREIAQLDEPVWFLAAGQRTEETLDLEEQAQCLLPNRWRFLTWPHNQTHLLYGAADLFALASLSEGFALVIIEAILTELPVIIHNGPVFQWIADGFPIHLIDMASEGTLRGSLLEMLAVAQDPPSRDPAVLRFSWEALIPHYLNMYESVMNKGQVLN